MGNNCSGCGYYRVVPGGKSESDEFVCWYHGNCPYGNDDEEENEEEYEV